MSLRPLFPTLLVAYTSFLILSAGSSNANAEPQVASDASLVKRGRYLAIVAGCNDCHTEGFAQSGGKLPEKAWLLGSAVGWRGPWGTTYPINLRKLVSSLPLRDWLILCESSTARPPMPSYALHEMEEEDRIALWTFIRSLGDGGAPMPAGLPPGTEPTTPYINFLPINLQSGGAAPK